MKLRVPGVLQLVTAGTPLFPPDEGRWSDTEHFPGGGMHAPFIAAGGLFPERCRGRYAPGQKKSGDQKDGK